MRPGAMVPSGPLPDRATMLRRPRRVTAQVRDDPDQDLLRGVLGILLHFECAFQRIQRDGRRRECERVHAAGARV